MTSRKAQAAGFSLLEVLTALAVFGVALIPVLTLSLRGVSQLEADTIRFQAESICHNTIERFGKAQDNLVVFLKPTGDPAVLEGGNLWVALPEVYAAMGHERLDFLVKQFALAMRVQLKKNVTNGVDVLVCEITYALPKAVGTDAQRVAYVRFLLHDHTH